MHYREYRPSPNLARFIRCIWFLRAEAETSPPVERVVPDGSPELVIQLADPFHELDRDGRFRAQSDLVLAGQIDRPLLIAPTGEVDLIGVRFHPAGLHPLLAGLRVSELTNQRVALAALDPRLATALRDVALGRDDDERIFRLERVLASRIQDRAEGMVDRAVAMVRQAQGNLSVAEVADRLGVDPRRLQRGFRREVGIPIKVLAEVFRFQRIFAFLESSRPVDWATLALDCGYYDQAHLIRDFRRFSGQSPLGFLHSGHTLSDHFTGFLPGDRPI